MANPPITKGNATIVYRWYVQAAGAAGVLAGKVYETGGFPVDNAGAPTGDVSQLPALIDLITSPTKAFSECLASVRRHQSRGIDVGGRVLFTVMGTPADNNQYPTFENDVFGRGTSIMLLKVDYPEHGILKRLELWNRQKSGGGVPDLQLPQEDA